MIGTAQGFCLWSRQGGRHLSDHVHLGAQATRLPRTAWSWVLGPVVVFHTLWVLIKHWQMD